MYRKVFYIIFCALVLFSVRSSNGASAQLEESLLEEEGAGAAVVLLSAVHIRSTGIFGDDNDLLPRIAYVETRDGSAANTYREGYHGGIWAVGESAFLSTKDDTTYSSLTAVFDNILYEFGIDWPSTTWSDLRKPFYSALAARLVLSITAAPIPASSDVQGQASFWAQYYNPSGSTSNFVSAITSTCTRVASHAETYASAYTSYYNHPHVYSYNCGFWGWSACYGSNNHQHSQTSYALAYTLVYTLENVCCDGFQGTPPNCYLTTIGFLETSYAISESTSHLQVPVVRSGSTQSAAVVVVATDTSSGTASEIDYVPVVEAIEFQSGESEKEVSISLVNDKHSEEDETFELYITGTNGVILSPHPLTMVVITNEDHVPGQPQNLQQTVLSSTSASIQWQAPPITNPHNLPLMYTLLLLEEQFGLPSISLDIDSSHTTYTFTQLEEFNTYTCTIYLVNEVGTGLPSSISFMTQEDAPASSPQSLTATALSSTSISLSWIAPPLIDQNGIVREYRVTVVEVETDNVRELTSTAATLIVSSLHPYYNYQCSVSAYTVGQGPYTDNITVQTLEDVPSGYPQNFTAEPISSRSAVVNWDPPLLDAQNGEIISYVINVTEVETEEMFQLVSTENTLTIDSLSPYTNYICVIAAATSAGVGTFSTPLTFQTFEDVPTSSPQNLVGIAFDSQTISLSWDLPPPREQNGVIRGYKINITEVETGTTWQVTSINSSVTVPMLHPYYTYEWRVSAVTIGDGPYSETSTVTTLEDVPISPPQTTVGTAPTSRSITLQWNPPPFEDQNGIIVLYQIIITEVESRMLMHYITSGTSITVSDLHPYYTYQWAVSASTTVGYGPYTEISTVMTLEELPTSPPQTVLGTVLDSRTVLLTWEPPPPEEQNGLIREYVINITEVNTGAMWQLVSTTNSETLYSLHPDYVYDFVVSAVTIGAGPYSAIFSVSTPEDVPTGYPQNFTGTATSSMSATLTWAPPLLEDQNGVITGYIINITVVETGETMELFSVSNSLTLESLSPFTTYICIIAATTSIGTGTFSTPITTFTPEDVPTGSPQNLTGSSPNSTAIFLSWEAPPPREQNGIIRQYWINVTEVVTGRFWQTYSTTTTKELSSLHPYYEYQCVIAAYTIGVGPYSDVITVISAEDVPSSPPQNPVGAATGSRSMYLSWYPPPAEDQNGIMREYRIEITEVDTGRILDVVSYSTSINVSSLHPHYRYEWIVAAFTIDTGPYTAVSTVMTDEDAPTGPPQALSGDAESSSSISLAWQPPLQNEANGIIQYYTVRVTEVKTGQFFEFNNTDTSVNVGELQAYNAYEVRVAAFTVGLGPFSASVEVTTLEKAPTAPPTNIVVVRVTGETLSLSWDPPPASHQNGVIRQYVIIITHTETDIAFSVNSATTSITVNDLIPLHTYSYSIAAETVAVGPYSEVIDVTLPEGAPTAPPTNVTVTVVDATSISIRWEAPPPEKRNGVIRMYFINITEVETLRVFQLSTNTTPFIVSTLQPSYTYEIQVSAFTLEMGPFSIPLTVTTPAIVSSITSAVTLGVSVPVGVILVVVVLLLIVAAAAFVIHKRRSLDAYEDDKVPINATGKGNRLHSMRPPSVAMGTSELYQPASFGKMFAHGGGDTSRRSSVGGQQYSNPLYDGFEDEETEGYAKDCKYCRF